MGAGEPGDPRGPRGARGAARERRARPGRRPPELGAAGQAHRIRPGAANNRRPGAQARRPAGRAVAVGRARPGRGASGQGRARPAPSARLQVRRPGRIVSPSGRPIVPRRGPGGRPSAICRGVIGVLPARQLRPGPRAPAATPTPAAGARGRSPRASCEDRPLRPGPAVPHGGSGEAPGPLTGLDKRLSPPRLGSSAACAPPGEGEGELPTSRA